MAPSFLWRLYAAILFSHRKHSVLEKDPEGAEFDTLESAHREALLAAREILAEKILADEVIDGAHFEISDGAGKVLKEVPFRSAMRLDE